MADQALPESVSELRALMAQATSWTPGRSVFTGLDHISQLQDELSRRSCLTNFLLSYVPIEPVLERSRADARISAGGERLIVYYQAVVARINICDHLAWIFCRA
jgi:hypothetical protein